MGVNLKFYWLDINRVMNKKIEELKNEGIKKGKLPTSHCYNQVLLLRSRPGRFRGS